MLKQMELFEEQGKKHFDWGVIGKSMILFSPISEEAKAKMLKISPNNLYNTPYKEYLWDYISAYFVLNWYV